MTRPPPKDTSAQKVLTSLPQAVRKSTSFFRGGTKPKEGGDGIAAAGVAVGDAVAVADAPAAAGLRRTLPR
jgi:hypothetical protein